MSAPTKIHSFIRFDKEHELWLGQGVEFDITASAASKEKLMEALGRILEGFVEACSTSDQNELECVPRTPKNVRDAWGAFGDVSVIDIPLREHASLGSALALGG